MPIDIVSGIKNRIGTRSASNIIIDNANGNATLTLANGKALLFSADNQVDIGASGATRPRDLYLARNAVMGGTLTLSGALGVTADSATAFTVAKTGTNYTFQVDTSTASAATGIKITGAAAAGGIAIAAISSGANENLTIDAKGSGTIALGNTSTGSLTLNRATTINAAASIDGSADAVQLTVKGHSTQTNNIVLVEQDGGTDLLTLDNNGLLALPTQGSTGGLVIGTDSNLYRNAANVLKTDDALIVAGLLTSEVNLVVGTGEAGATPAGSVVRAPNAVGTNIAGAAFTVAGGQSTGSGAGGSLIFQTSPVGGAGSSPNALVTQATITSAGEMLIGGKTTVYSAGYTLQGIGSIWFQNHATDGQAFGVEIGANEVLLYSHIVGSGTQRPMNWYVGAQRRMQLNTDGSLVVGSIDTQPGTGVIRAANANLAANNTAGSLYVGGGRSTGNAVGGSVVIQTAPAGVAGSALNEFVERVIITAAGQIQFPTATATGSSLLLGGDVELWRSAANVLYTPDNMQFDETLQLRWVGGGQTSYIMSDASHQITILSVGQMLVDANGGRSILNGAGSVVKFTLDPQNFNGWATQLATGARSGTDIAGYNMTISAGQSTGSGAGGSLIFQTSAAGGAGAGVNALSSRWQINSAGHLLASTDNTVDIGASGATRPANAYLGTGLYVGDGRLLQGGFRMNGGVTGGSFVFSSDISLWILDGGGGQLYPAVDDAFNFGQTTTRPRNSYFGRLVDISGLGANLGELAVGAPNDQRLNIKCLTELTIINAAATTDTAIQIPANAIVIGVSVRVTTVIPTANNFTVTGATSATAFQTGASVSAAADTTDAGTKSCPYLNTAAQAIRITPDIQPAANTGRVRVTIHYLTITPPTS